MKEGSQMSANVIIFFINLSSIHPEPKILLEKKKKAHRGTLCSMEIYWRFAVFSFYCVEILTTPSSMSSQIWPVHSI